MKSGYLFIFIVIISVNACLIFRPIGKCTYGKYPDQHGTVVIESMEKEVTPEGSGYSVKVKGFFNKSFFYKDDDFHRDFTAKGYKPGKEMKGTIRPGGPCPPIYSISD